VCNAADIVPTLPLPVQLASSKHTCPYEHPNAFVLFSCNTDSAYVNHALSTYLHGVTSGDSCVGSVPLLREASSSLIAPAEQHKACSA
jgi:hypothetical protein